MHDDVARQAPGAVAGAAERASYAREGPSLLWLALSTAFLTILTLGLYRFWMTTRLRRHYWSAIQVMGDPFEYTGTGLEKLLGFLLALVVLAIYLAVINLGFAFAGLVQFGDPIALQIAINLSLVAVVPFIYYATYRARRYVMARTRWRGIRFGMEQAAWGYTRRALVLVLVSALSLGLLYPLQHFRLTKYMTDRSWFGDQRFHQGGTWRALMGYWLWVYAGIAALVVGIALVVLAPEETAPAAIGAILITAGYFAAFLFGLRYRVAAFRYLWGHRSLGGARFANDIDTGAVIGITLAGSAAAGAVAVVLALVIVAAGAVVGIAVVGADAVVDVFDALRNDAQPPRAAVWAITGGAAVFYLLTIGFAVALGQIFVSRPILRRQAEGMRISNAAALAASQQRAHDAALEAGGFADALGVDIGAGLG